MHTAICTFDDQPTAQQAVDRLVQSGFARQDVHMEYRHPDGTPMDTSAAKPPGEHQGLGERVGHFFSRMFGHEDAADHAGRYSSAMERGLCVVFVDAHSEAEAERAQNVLHGMEAGDLNLVHRAGQRPLREIVGEARGADLGFGTARGEMGAVHNATDERETLFPPERALASQGWGEQRTLEVADRGSSSSDLEPGPGVRSDADKPNR